MEKNNNNDAINIELSEELAEGVYANLAIITHSPTEFIVDFVRMMPNMPNPRVKSRVILTPQHAKHLLGALQENIKRYEQAHGPIKEMGHPQLPPMDFNTPKGQA